MLNGHSRLVQAPLSRWPSMNDIIVVSLRDQRVQTMLLLTLSLVAVALTAGGVYGLTRSAPARASSPFNSRPRCGVARSTVKTRGETSRPANVSAPSGPSTVDHDVGP